MTMRGAAAPWPRRRRQARPFAMWTNVAFVHIAKLASVIESDPARVDHWYRFVRIRELGEMTARDLVLRGDARLAIKFLRSIRGGERG
jgi:hypothetical protein